jgi:hypothetical protein
MQKKKSVMQKQNLVMQQVFFKLQFSPTNVVIKEIFGSFCILGEVLTNFDIFELESY